MRSPCSPHRKCIDRCYALAAKEVSVEQFLRFRKNHAYDKEYAPTPDSPMNWVTWYDAAAYCNWLSEREGIPKDQWCYEPNADGKFAEGMKVKPNYLHLTGYRLPSEAEWEYACRAGGITSRYYGETEELLGRYAWYMTNSEGSWLLPGGTLKPNGLAFFDMLGNALEWCQEMAFLYAPASEDKWSNDIEYNDDNKGIMDNQIRVLRGGSFARHPEYVRSAQRFNSRPTARNGYVGFRPARTLTP